MQDPKGFITFMGRVAALKKLDRAGWIECGIKGSESVADHMFGTAIIALVLSDKFGIDKDKAIKMSLVHDLAESIIGDITPSQKVSREEKHVREAEAFAVLCEGLENKEEIIRLWNEYEKGESKEARFVKGFDTLDMMFQASEYGTAQPDADLRQFWDYSEKFDFGELKEIYEAIKSKAFK